MSGLFITLEGGEGSGKTTVAESIIKRLTQQGIEAVYTREPGGIPIAEEIRQVILDPNHTEMDSRTEALLYAAARRQHLVEKVKPAIAAGKVVLCDRFIDSSIAYQGFARGIGAKEVLAINEFAIEGFMPDLTIFLDINPKLGLERIAANKGREVNRLDLEALDFHDKVYEAYQQQVVKNPNRIIQVDATQSVEAVSDAVYQLIMERIKRVSK